MFRNLFTPPRKVPKDVADEIASLCRADQIDRLTAPRGLHRDIGLDCGCSGPSSVARHTYN